MNEGDNNLHPWIEPELEARIIALVLGESSDFEAEELERLIGEQPELAMFRKRMEAIHGLLHEVGAGEPEDADESWKLPKGRREAVLAAIGGAERGVSFGLKPKKETDESESPERVVEEMPVSGSVKDHRKSHWKQIISIGAAAGLILFVGVASFYSLAKNEYNASASYSGGPVARPEEEIALAREVGTKAIREDWELEDTPVLPLNWASQPGAIRSWDVDSAPVDQLAMIDAAETTDAATSLGRLKGVFGNINSLSGVETGGLTVVSNLDVDSNELMRRQTAGRDSGSDASKLRFPITPAPQISRDAPFDSPELPPLLGATKKELVGDVRVSTIGSGVTIRAYSTADLSEPISTAGKTSLAFPEMPGVAGDSDLRDRRWAGKAMGHGGRDNNALVSNDTAKDLERRLNFDVNGAVEDLEKSQPESGQQPGRGQAQSDGYAAFGLVANAEGEPANQAGGTLTASGGTSGGVISLDAVNSTGGVIAMNGPGGEGDKGRKDLEGLPERGKRESEVSDKWGQTGGSFERTNTYRFKSAAETPAPAPSAKPVPAPTPAPAKRPLKAKPVSEVLAKLAEVSAVTGPVAAAESEPVADSRGLIEVSGRQNSDSDGDGVMPESRMPALAAESLGEREQDLAQVELRKMDGVPAVGDLPMMGQLFEKREKAEPTQGALVEKSKQLAELADLTGLPSQVEQRLGDFDNGMGNSVYGPYIDKPDEGSVHSLSDSDDVFTRDFLGGANNIRGINSREAGPKPVDPGKPESETELGFDYKSTSYDLIRKTRDSTFLPRKGDSTVFGVVPPGGPEPVARPELAKNLGGVEREQMNHKGHGQVAPIRITGNTKTREQVLRRELAADEQLGAGGYDTVRGFEKRIAAESKLAEPGLVDASGATGGGSVNIGGGFQGRNMSPESTPVSAEGAEQTDSSVLAINSAGILDAPGGATAISNTGSIRASSGKVGGRVILDSAGGAVSNRGSIQANAANGAGGEIQIGESVTSVINVDGNVTAAGISGNGGMIEVLGKKSSTANITGAVSGQPEQSLTAIKDTLALNPAANGAAVHWDGFSVSAGEITKFSRPDSSRKRDGTEQLVDSLTSELQERAMDPQEKLSKKAQSDQFFYEDFFPAEHKDAAPSTKLIAELVPRVVGGGSAQHEWQRYPGHPATANLGPVSADGEEENAEAIQWSNSQASFGAFVSGNVGGEPHIRTSGSGNVNAMKGRAVDETDLESYGYGVSTSRADINVPLSGGILRQSGGRHSDYVAIGHGGYDADTAGERKSRDSKSGAIRQWREGFARNQGVAGIPEGTEAMGAGGEFLVDTTGDARLSGLRSGTEGINLNLTPEVVEFEGFINYGSPIDGLIAERPATVTARSGQRGKIELTREFIYPTEYDPPELPNSGDQQIRFSTEIGSTSKDGKYQYHFQRQARVDRVAPPAGLEEKNAAEESFSTFSLHVSDVSFKLAQAALAKGEWPEAGKVRIEEFVNALDYGDPNPSQDDKVACRVEQAIHPFLQQRNLMRVAMRTAAAGRAGDTPLRLTFLLDNSGSMERADREETVRRAFALLADQLQPIDQVTLISFARQPRLLADKVSGDKSRNLVEVVSNLPSEGGTNLEAALQLAFEKAQEQKADGAQNRIVLLTDGAANLGNAKPESLAAMVESMREEGIAFDAAGIGADGLNDEILEALTRKGDGRYYLLDRPEDADDGFARQIAGALRPAAKNVKVQVEFNPDRVGNYKLLGFEKHRLKKEDFRDDSVDAAEMAAEEAGVAVYQFEAKPDGKGDVGFVSVRFRDMSSGEMVEKRWPIPYEPSAPRSDQAAPSMQIATAAALLAAKLNGEPLGETVDLDDLARTVSSLPASFQNKKRIQQLRQMIEQARELAAK